MNIRSTIQLCRSAAMKPAVVFGVVAVVYIATGTYGGNMSRDTFTAEVAAWALAVHHTLNLGSFPLYKGDPALWLAHGRSGWEVSNRFPGAVLAAVPLYALFGGHLSFVPGTITAALMAAGAAAVIYKVLLRFEGPRVALIATTLFAFATSNWTVSGRELWEHPGAELVIACGMLAALNRRWTLSGVAFGAAVMFRPHLGVGVLVVGLGLWWIERNWRTVVRFGLAAGLGVISFFAWNYLVYGHLTIEGGYQGITPGGMGVTGFLTNIAGTLVSPERGVLVCSPIFLVAALGLRLAWQESPKLVKVFCLAGLAYLASQLWLIRFSGGDGFIGYRVCLETIVWSAPLLVRAGTIGARRVGTTATWVLAGFSVAFFSAGAFVQGETNGIVDPWTNWTPLLVGRQYGWDRVALGAAIGVAGVLGLWAVLHRMGQLNALSTEQSELAEVGPPTLTGEALPSVA